MKFCIQVLAIFALVATASAQTTNSNYEVTNFGAPPPGEEWGDTISVAADGKGSILVFRRAEPPVLVYNRSGELQSAWGEGMFVDTTALMLTMKASSGSRTEGPTWFTSSPWTASC
jgi:hypothetical protein